MQLSQETRKKEKSRLFLSERILISRGENGCPSFQCFGISYLEITKRLSENKKEKKVAIEARGTKKRREKTQNKQGTRVAPYGYSVIRSETSGNAYLEARRR